MSDSTDRHDYQTPAAGTEDWHEPLNENFEQLDIDVEVRDVAANRGDYAPEEGAKFLETDSGIIYVGDGDDWIPQLAMAYYDEDGNLDCGELADCVENGAAPTSWGKNAKSVHEGAIVFGDSTQRVIWSEAANEIRSQMPMYGPSFITDGVTIGENNVSVTGGVNAGSVSASAVGTDAIEAGSLTGSDDVVSIDFGEEADVDFTILPDGVFINTYDDDEINSVIITEHGINSDLEITAPAFNQNSSAAAKTNVEPVDTQEILGAVESMPINSWEFTERNGGQHIGPMAEDFAERFPVSSDSQTISTVDADGVAFAAIQGLAERLADKTEQLNEQVATLKEENASLRSRIASLEEHVYK